MGICDGLKGQSTPACALMGGTTDSEGDQSLIMPPICQNEASPTTIYRNTLDIRKIHQLLAKSQDNISHAGL